MVRQFRLSSIDIFGKTLQSGWSSDEAKMREIYENFKKKFPLWIHILETR